MTKQQIRFLEKHRQQAIQKMYDMRDYYPRVMEKKFNQIAQSVIDDWYNDYGNRSEYYDPVYSLNSAYKIEVDGFDWNIEFYHEDFEASEIPYEHHQDNEIVYNNTFILGYHGGSWGRGLHSNVPHWRAPMGYYTHWSTSAYASFSPYARLRLRLAAQAKAFRRQQKSDIRELERILQPLIRRQKNGSKK